MTPTAVSGLVAKGPERWLVYASGAPDREATRCVEEELGKDWPQGIEHPVVAERISKLPLFDRPRNEG